MRPAAWVVLAAVALASGFGLFVAVRDGSESPPRQPSRGTAEVGTPDPPADEAAATPLLVWTTGGLPSGFPERVAALDGVEQLTVVAGDLVDLTASFDTSGAAVDASPPGMRIPLDAIAVDPATYPTFVNGPGRDALARLDVGEALLGETSARLRRLEPAGTLELVGGQRLTIAGIVADEAVGAAEVVVAAGSAFATSITTPRFLLLTYSGQRQTVEEAIAALLPGTPVRFRAPGEARFLRHADLVLPQALVKERFGEFAYASGADRYITVETTYEIAHIVTVDVPVLGSITCHREVIPALEGALRELEELGLASLVDPGGYQGCFVPSIIPGAGGVSRHSWGIAIDVNFVPNPTGLPSFADPRLIEVMGRWGFVSGANFLLVDPGHFEYVGPPQDP